MMDIPPGILQRYGEMGDEVTLAHEATADVNIDVFRFSTNARMDDDILTDERGDP